MKWPKFWKCVQEKLTRSVGDCITKRNTDQEKVNVLVCQGIFRLRNMTKPEDII